MSTNKNGILASLSDQSLRGDQPLTDAQKEFVDSIYTLFELFKTLNYDYLTEIQLARSMRRLADPNLDSPKAKEKGPQLNTLNSTMDNMIADYVDNMPEVVLMPESSSTEEAARQMTDVVSWVFHHADLPEVWQESMEDVIVTGTGVFQHYFDPDMDIGGEKGNIGLVNWPPESWLPDPAYDNYQDGRAVIKVCNHPISWFVQHYPEQAPYIDPDGEEMLDYMQDGRKNIGYNHDDPLVCLLEVWYRRYDASKKRYSIHMAKVAGNCLLEDSREDHSDGVYTHGMYPFTVLRFRKRKGTAYGAGMCHEFADTQRMINRYIRYIDENIRASARFKIIVSEQAGVDMTALLDLNQEVVKTKNAIVKEGMDWFQPQPLNSLVPTMMGALQDTMKQDSGQNQWSRGEGGQGVTAASAINMLQNAGGKISRMHINDFLNQFKTTCEQIISLIGEFFEDGRIFSIYGEQGGKDVRSVKLDHKKMFGGTEAYRKPAFMVRIMPQRSSPDQIEAFNNKVLRVIELSQQAGLPIPAVVAIKMLQMTGKEQIVPLLEEVDTQQQLMQQMKQQLDTVMQQLDAVAGENEELKKNLQIVLQDAQQKQQAMSAIGQQMAAQPAQAAQTAPSMQEQPSA